MELIRRRLNQESQSRHPVHFIVYNNTIYAFTFFIVNIPVLLNAIFSVFAPNRHITNVVHVLLL